MIVWLALLAATQDPRPADAPSVEAARRSIQEEVRLARQQAPGLQIINVTSTTTPEVEHLATGARCRFWYQAAEIDHPWLDDRAMSCGTQGGWVRTGLSIYSLQGPRRPVAWGLAPLLRGEPVTLETLATASMAARARTYGSSGTEAAGATDRREVITAAGRRLAVISFAVGGYGGAPGGTPQVRHTANRLLIVDGWVFQIDAEGPSHYRRDLEGYADAGLQRLIESLETAARLPTFRASP